MINYSVNDLINDDTVLRCIIKNKHEPSKHILRDCELFILDDYEKYKNSTSDLGRISPDVRITLQARDVLKKTYEDNPKALQMIKKDIKESLPDILKAKCPYCMISAHNTFDHYLDKSDYPEYALFSLNLVPSCSECNSFKNAFLLDENGKRLFINFMFDELPDYPFLKFKLGFAEGKPFLIDINLEFRNCNPVNDVILNHFEKLKLYDRLDKQFESFVSTIIAEFKEYMLDKMTVKQMLEKKISAWEKTKGMNNWEVCILRGILENEDILDDISVF
ncbi:MAG: hypothetical protein E7286_09895 [Lachnospiraceae bacterium]|nr:hypothetical protein [Lachnospiraceae bacterium]